MSDPRVRFTRAVEVLSRLNPDVAEMVMAGLLDIAKEADKRMRMAHRDDVHNMQGQAQMAHDIATTMQECRDRVAAWNKKGTNP